MKNVFRFHVLAGALGLVAMAGCGDNLDTAPDGAGPDAAPPPVRVRKSWTRSSPEERKKFVDGVVLLKQKTDLTWDYTSLCEGEPGEYPKNAYDYFVELHTHAFLGMAGGGGHGGHGFDDYNRPHMGPHFLPWHRELLLRFEQELRDVLGDPEYVMPYWDFAEPPTAFFSTADIGSMGSCPAAPDQGFPEVTGYITDQGFRVNIADIIGEGGPADLTILCGESKPITRGAGCLPQVSALPTREQEEEALAIPTYDLAPYNNLDVEETQSFRQYVEGFTNEDDPFCQFAGCRMHGAVHVWVAGSLGAAAAPNDPIFFLLHANIDRIWAEWQERHGNDTYPSAAPSDYTGGMFEFEGPDGQPVQARTMFDQRALGYIYDTQAP